MISNSNTKLLSSTYLLSCDLINKYNLLSIYEEPKVSKIILSISLKEIQKVSYVYHSDDSVGPDIQMKTFFFFYLLLGSSPFIVFQNIKVTKGIRSKSDGDFLLKVTISNPNRISSFLSNLFIENKFLIETSEFELFKSSFKSKIQTNNLKGSFNIKIPADFFFDINHFFSYKVQDLNLSKINLNANFIYENMPKDKNISNVIQNSFFFK